MSEFKIASLDYTDNNFLAAKKNEDGSYNVEGKVVFEKDITTPAGDFATKADLGTKQDNLTSDNAGNNITITGSGSSLKINAQGGGTWYESSGSAVYIGPGYGNTPSDTDNLVLGKKDGSAKIELGYQTNLSSEGFINLSANCAVHIGPSSAGVKFSSNGETYFKNSIYDKNNNEILGGGGGVDNYVPLGSYGDYQKDGALPIGSNSTASGYYTVASGYYSTASGGSSTAFGANSVASNNDSAAFGKSSTASGYWSTALGGYSIASEYCSTASGYYSTASGGSSTASGTNSSASGDLAQTFGSYGRNANDCCTVIAAIKGVGTDCGGSIEYATQLYLIPKGSPLAVQYEDGEACLGYVTVDSDWNKIASGTKKLSELLNNNVNTFEPKLTYEP